MDSTSTWRSVVNKVSRRCILAFAVVGLTCAGLVGAQTAATAPATAAAAKPAAPVAVVKPVWTALTPLQKTALEPLAGEWDRLDATRKQKWLEIANRFASMKPDEQARVHEKMREWVKMTPDERRLVRENFTKAKKLDTTQKSEQWEKYQQLPEEEKQKLAADAIKKKQVTNLPAPTQPAVNKVAPIKRAVPPASAPATVPAATSPAAGAPAPAPANAK